MFAVLTMDQRASAASRADLVASWRDDLNASFQAGLYFPFARTAGDEMQALFTDPEALLDALMRALDSREWWVGVGLGGPRPLGGGAPGSRCPAFRAARSA